MVSRRYLKKIQEMDYILEKSYDKILQPINLLKDNDIFHNKYNLYEGYSLS